MSCNQTPKKNSNEKSTLKEVSETPNILTVNYNLDEMTTEEHSELGTNARNCRWKTSQNIIRALRWVFWNSNKTITGCSKRFGGDANDCLRWRWPKKVLTSVKTRDVLEKVQKKINVANHEIENLVGTRTRIMQSKQKNVD